MRFGEKSEIEMNRRRRGGAAGIPEHCLNTLFDELLIFRDEGQRRVLDEEAVIL